MRCADGGDQSLKAIFKPQLVAIAVAAEHDFVAALCTLLNQRPDSLVREEEDSAERQDGHQPADVEGNLAGVFLNRKHVLERNLLEIHEAIFIAAEGRSDRSP